MDVIVTPAEGGTVWQLTDLLGRSMGRITASAGRWSSARNGSSVYGNPWQIVCQAFVGCDAVDLKT
jgi:hypothetical protein